MRGPAPTSHRGSRGRRRRSLAPEERIALFGVVIGAHAVFLYLVTGAVSVTLWGDGLANPGKPPADEVALEPLEPSCAGDALLAAAAGGAICATPFAGPTCLDDVDAHLR